MAIFKVFDGTSFVETTGASGDVVGPGSATDNAVARFDGATGKKIQDTATFLVDDDGDLDVYHDVGPLSANLSSYSTAGDGTLLRLRHADGTRSSPSAIDLNDRLGELIYAGHDGSSFHSAGVVRCTATENWDGSSHGCQLLFRTTPDGGSAAVTRMIIDQDGSYDFGAGAVTNVGNVDGRDVSVDGAVLDKGYSAILEPAGLYAADLTSALTILDGQTRFAYLRRATQAWTTCTLNARVTTAYVVGGGGGHWAEVGVCTGAFVMNGNASLTLAGSTDVAATYNSTGIKTTTVSLSGITAGDDLWFAFSNDVGIGGTVFQIRATLADDIQSGVLQEATVQLSAMGSPQATTLAGAATAGPWARLKV